MLDFLEEANQILKYIHNYKIIHRDIKPDNFIRRQADNKQADNKWVLIDFGASRILSETALMGGATVIGTPEYMAPEQNRGKIVPASDLYSLGVICVQLITGQPTIEMFDLQTNRWLWTKFLPKDQQVSKSFVSLINDLISPSLGDRLESTLQVDQRLKRIRHRKKIGTLSNFIPPNSGFVPKANYVNPDQQPTTPLIKPNPLNANTYSPQKKSSSEKPYPLDSKQLASYLKWRRWQAADGETWRLINESLGKSPNYFLFPQDLPLIPCNVLQEIDRLWLEYSKNRFGFSPQLRVYQKFGGEYPLFCQELGWPMVPSARQPERDYQYKTKAPLGHLPSRRQMGGSALWKNAKAFYQRLTECDVV